MIARLLLLVTLLATPALAQDAARHPEAMPGTPTPADRTGLSVRDFCTPSTGRDDDTACFQAAVDSLCRRPEGGGALLVPRGTYRIDAAVGVGVPCPGIHIAGEGWGDRDGPEAGTRIMVTGRGDKPIFDFAAPVKRGDRYFYGGGVRDLQFRADNPAGHVDQRGPMVRFAHCSGCLVERVYAFNAFRFVVNDAGYGNRVTQFFADQVAIGGEAIKVEGSDAKCEPDRIGECPTRGDLFTLDHGTIDASLAQGQRPGACIRISNFAATTMITSVVCNQTSIGLNIDCPDSAQIAACPQFVSAWDFETEVNGTGQPNGAAGIVASDVVHLNCHDCHVFGYGVTTLVRLSSARFAGASDAQFFGGTIENALGSCVSSSIQGLEWHGGQVAGCGQGGAGAYGFDLRPNAVGGPAASGSTLVEGARLCLAVGIAPTAMGGVLLEPATDFTVVTSNIFRGCVRGVTDRSGGAHNVVANNAGP